MSNWPTRCLADELARAARWKPWEVCQACRLAAAATTRPSLAAPAASLNLCTDCAAGYDAVAASARRARP